MVKEEPVNTVGRRLEQVIMRLCQNDCRNDFNM